MLQFSSYLIEAGFSSGKIDKAVTLIANIVGRAVGQTFYRYGGKKGYVSLDHSATGYLFFTPRRYAYQLTYRLGIIDSLYIWKQWEVYKDPDFFIDLKGHNAVQIVKTIANIVKKPMLGKTAIKESILYEAKRVSHSDFSTLALADHGNISSLTMDQIKKTARNHGVGIPSTIHQLRGTGGKGKFNIGTDQNAVPRAFSPAATPAAVKDKEPELFVLGRAPSGRMFKPSYDQVEKALEKHLDLAADPDTLPNKLELKDADTLFGNLVKLIRVVVKGGQPSLLVFGGPGIGKSYTVEEELKKQGVDFTIISGKTTPVGVYRTLFLNRKRMIVFDDSDSVFNDQDSRNLIKAALDSKKVKELSWISNRTTNVTSMSKDEREAFTVEVEGILKAGGDESVKLPSSFEYTGKIIFISNLSEGKIEPAILSRGFKIDMTLTDAEVFKRMASIVDNIGSGEFSGVSYDAKKEVLATLEKMNKLGSLKNPNMRSFIAAMRIYSSGIPNWQELMQYT